MIFHTVLIDDEHLALQRLTRLLESYRDIIDIIGYARNGQEAVEKINTLNPDLIFLDIQMPEMNGFEVLDQISTLPLVIFCTAYDEFALKAFETNSIDYLVKPVEQERLNKTIEKLRRITKEDKNGIDSRLENVLSQIRKRNIKRIQVRMGDNIFFINTDDIFFFRAADKYIEARTFDKSYLLSISLDKLESEISSEDFIRIHRSAIINLNHIEKIFRRFGSRYSVRMRDKEKTELDVSRKQKHRLGI